MTGKCKLDPATRHKISQTQRANSASGRQTGLRHPSLQKRATFLANAKMSGSGQFVRIKRDLPDHVHAKIYPIVSQQGGQCRVCNPDLWCCGNQAIFEDGPKLCVQPLWQRAANGIYALAVARSASTSWRGWRLVAIDGRARIKNLRRTTDLTNKIIT